MQTSDKENVKRRPHSVCDATVISSDLNAANTTSAAGVRPASQGESKVSAFALKPWSPPPRDCYTRDFDTCSNVSRNSFCAKKRRSSKKKQRRASQMNTSRPRSDVTCSNTAATRDSSMSRCSSMERRATRQQPTAAAGYYMAMDKNACSRTAGRDSCGSHDSLMSRDSCGGTSSFTSSQGHSKVTWGSHDATIK